MSTVLANANAFGLLLDFLAFRYEDFHDERGHREEEPLDWNPVPSDAHPPDDSVVLIDKLRLLNNVDRHIR